MLAIFPVVANYLVILFALHALVPDERHGCSPSRSAMCSLYHCGD
jgi:hypothetical protein